MDLVWFYPTFLNLEKILSYYRHPKTHQEMAINAAPEISILIRPKRRTKNLPNAWDDVLVINTKESPKKRIRSKNNFRNTIRGTSFEL